MHWKDASLVCWGGEGKRNQSHVRERHGGDMRTPQRMESGGKEDTAYPTPLSMRATNKNAYEPVSRAAPHNTVATTHTHRPMPIILNGGK